MTATAQGFTFTVNPDIMQGIKENRLRYFEQQIGESQLNILILQSNITTYNLPQDINSLATEKLKLEKLIANYQIVQGVDTNVGANTTNG